MVAKRNSIVKVEKEVLCTINGFTIYKDNIYEVVDRGEDYSAPTGMIELGVSKFPIKENADWIVIRFDNHLKAFDTGFYEGSPCYKNMPSDYVTKEVKKRCKMIRDPFEFIRGKGITAHNNDSFWCEYAVELFPGKIFNTSDPTDVFELYIAILSKGLVPLQFVGDPAYIDSMYCIKDREYIIDNEFENIDKEADALTTFGTLILTQEGQQKLSNILLWIDYINSPDIDIKYLKKNVLTCIKDPSKLDKFNKAVEYAEDPDNYQVMKHYAMLSTLQYSNVLVKKASGFYYKNYSLGPNLKQTAEKMITDEYLQTILPEMIESLEMVMTV